MAMRKKDETVVFPNAAAIDVGAASHWVAVPRERDAEPVREFGAMTDDLHALGDWLLACGIDTVALSRQVFTGFPCMTYWNGAA